MRWLLLLAAATLPAAAQNPSVRIAGRVQAHFSTSSGDSTGSYDDAAAVSSQFEIRRLRLEAEARIGSRAMMRIAPSVEMARLRMRDAFLRVAISDALGVTMGQEKKPMDRYSMISSNTLPSIERGARIRGLSSRSHSDVLEDNGYTEHDIGASVDLRADRGRILLKAGVYNGSGESTLDVNGAKTAGARITARLAGSERRPVLRVGAAFVSRDRGITAGATGSAFAPDSARRTNAWGFDLEWGDFRPGLHVIADAAAGTALRAGAHCLDGGTPIDCRVDNGNNLGALRPNAPDSAFATFASIQAVAAWRSPERRHGLVRAVEPAVRVAITDPDRDTNGDGVVLLTPVLNLYFSETTVLRAGYDLYRYRDAGTTHTASAIRIAWQSSF